MRSPDVEFRINDGSCTRGRKADIASEGINRLAIRPANGKEEIREICIDLTPPSIELKTKPFLKQLGGLYYARPDTLFSIAAFDELSGVRSIEVSTDGGKFAPYERPFTLPSGSHGIRCRAADAAGNSNDVMGGQCLTGGDSRVVSVEIRAADASE